MLRQIQIYFAPNASHKEKGEFFEDLLRPIMETQRYKVTQRINFTGTEIDLLCEHMDRAMDTALLECKAKVTVISEDIKNFSYDLIVTEKAKYGYFAHTSELQHQAAGMAKELMQKYPDRIFFWGPNKIIELFEFQNIICKSPSLPASTALTPTKQFLVFSFAGKFWVTIFSNQTLPTHYTVHNAIDVTAAIGMEEKKFVGQIDDVQGLQLIEHSQALPITKAMVSLDSVAEIQEAEEWDDYRPVGGKYFIGRDDLRKRLYQFIQNSLSQKQGRRIFFIEAKSGWGKSSIIAELRVRSRNKRNRNSLFVFAVDSRTATTSEFVSLAFAKMVSSAIKVGFVPVEFAELNISSGLDVLASDKVQVLMKWLTDNGRTFVLIFDQFEDVFRKQDLFRAFHKLMLDVHDQQGPIVVGFSWKSEIYIPIDNEAYGPWQQARSLAEQFSLEEFLPHDVDRVLKQLEGASKCQLPVDLKRRLRDLQRFPWLIKKLAIHCYHEMIKGVTPENLVDQNLNVDDLFKSDLEELSPAELRALNFIAKRGYEGEPFDVGEIDEKVQESEINSLRDKRLIVRSGGKYNIYWDNFRDYLVDGKTPAVAESFLLRQFPNPCIDALEYLLEHAPCNLAQLQARRKANQGTILNHLRELRYLGAVNKNGEQYGVRPKIKSTEDFKSFIGERLRAHIVVRAMQRIQKDQIDQTDVIASLQANYKGYLFSKKTWETYANYFVAWLEYAGIDFGRRLVVVSHRTSNPNAFTPQRIPERSIDLLIQLKSNQSSIIRTRKNDKQLYDLKSLGIITYAGQNVYLTKRGLSLIQNDHQSMKKEFALLAVESPKIRTAFDILNSCISDKTTSFEVLIGEKLETIESEAYRKVTSKILKGWAKFIVSATTTVKDVGDVNEETLRDGAD